MKKSKSASISAFLVKAQELGSKNMAPDMKVNCKTKTRNYKKGRPLITDPLKCSDWLSLTRNNTMEEGNGVEEEILSSASSLNSSDEGVNKKRLTEKCTLRINTYKETKRRCKKKKGGIYLETNPDIDVNCDISDNDLTPNQICSRIPHKHLTDTNTLLASNVDYSDSINDNSDTDSSSSQQTMKTVGQSSRASEWVKQVSSPLPLPGSSSAATTSWSMAVNQSSSKKRPSCRRAIRPSYIAGGLADRLHTMIEREKTSLSFWSHGCSIDDMKVSGSVTVRILQAVFVHSLLLTEALVLSSTSITDELLTDGKHVFVYFSMECAEKLPINTEAIIKISSPWQSFIVSKDDVVLISTNYCTLIEPGVNVPTRFTPRKPAKVSSPVSKPIRPAVHTKKLFKDSKDNIESSTKPGALVDCFSVSSMDLLSLVITVRAIYCCTDEKRYGARWTLLVEDDYRLFIEITIKHEHMQAWQDVVMTGLSQQFEVYNLQYIQRVDKGRKPKLTGLIESLSASRSYNNDYVEQPFYCKSTFCSFILQTQDNSYWNRRQLANPISIVHVDPVQYSRVTCIAKVVYCSYDEEKFHSKVGSSGNENTEDYFIYAVIHYINDTDNSTSYLGMIHLSDVCGTVPVSPGDLVTVTNAFVCGDHPKSKEGFSRSVIQCVLCMDQYSLMIPQEAASDTGESLIWPVVSIASLNISLLDTCDWWSHIPTLSVDSLIVNSFVSIKGWVTGVDEDNAFVWLTCADCRSCLETCSNERYKCDGCGQSTCDPCICIQVNVFITNPDHPPGWTVSVELSQETIMAFLPLSPSCVHQGLDVNPLINKLITLNICLVVDLTSKEGDSVLIHLKEIIVSKQQT